MPGAMMPTLIDHPLAQDALSTLRRAETPREAFRTALHRIALLLAAPEGLARLAAAHPDVSVLAAAVDRGLEARGYIRPGLGDAGDRLFGTGSAQDRTGPRRAAGDLAA